MKGGTIEVSGNVSDWLGGEMSGGLIRVRGNAGGQIGAAYRGSLSGMTDGTLIVDGTGGLEIAMRMKRGIIAIGGPVRDFAGLQMKGGTLVMRQGAELRTGAWMNRGTIISLTPIQILPTARRHLQPHVPPPLRQAPGNPRFHSRMKTRRRTNGDRRRRRAG
jgi:formylmethanofuran dehydrogenase subunit C